MRFARLLAALFALVVLAWAAAGWLGGRGIAPTLPAAESAIVSDDGTVAFGTPGGESPRGDAVDPPERRFALALDAAAEQARELVRLGETKSRNLPEILGEQRRMTARLDEIDALIASGALPKDADDAVTAYEAGARAVRDAMDKAESGFLKLDFGKVKSATDRMREGEQDLSRAARLLPK